MAPAFPLLFRKPVLGFPDNRRDFPVRRAKFPVLVRRENCPNARITKKNCINGRWFPVNLNKFPVFRSLSGNLMQETGSAETAHTTILSPANFGLGLMQAEAPSL